ncbi:MAG: O-antigen ligase family protein [Patescibacteria group bacterium]
MNNSSFKSAALWIIKIGFFIVPFIPLYVSRVLFFPYITGKAFAFRILVEIVLATWVFLAIFYKEYRPKKSALLIALSIFILIVTLATIFGVNPYKSFWSNYERMEGLVTYLHLFAYFLVLAHVFKKKDWNILLNLFIIASIYENSYAFLQKMGVLASPQGGTNRTDGTIGNPTYLAAYLVFILGFCLLLWFESKSKLQKWFYGLMSFWTLVTIYFTATRGAALGLLGGIIIFGILYLILKRPENSKEVLIKRVVIFSVPVILLICFGFWFFRDKPFINTNPVLSRLTSVSFTERTITSRFTIWSMSFEGFKEHPVLGWGPENYGVVFAKYYKPELYRQEPWFDRSHNIIFDWLINAGILGLLGYLSVLITAIYLLWKNFLKKNLSLEGAILLTTLLLVYLAQNLFVFDQIATYICLFTLLAYIHALNVSSGAAVNVAGKVPQNNAVPRYSDSDMAITAGILLIPLILMIYFINYKPLKANLLLLDAIKIQNQDYAGAFSDYEKALTYNSLGNEEIKEQVIRFATGIGGLQDVDAAFRDKVLRRAIQEGERGANENPLDARAYLFLGAIYQKVGLSDNALAAFNKALELSPKKQQTYFEIADVYIQKGDYQNAVKVLEKTFNDDRSFISGRINLSAVYILNHQQAEADKLLKEEFGTIEVADNILSQVYSGIKDYDRLAGVYRAFVKIDPKNIEYYKNLAGAYLMANRNAEAIESLKRAIKEIPSFRTEAENLIKQIKNQ